MLIRRGTDADDAAIRVVHDAAFAKPDAPGAETVEAKLVGELRADGDLLPALSLVAEIDGRIAGHVCCSHARIGSTPGPVGLGPLGVLPELQSTGVGSALMHAVIAAADALDLPAIVLLGSPGYYSRFGFAPAAEFGITPSTPDWEPYFQVRPLTTYSKDLTGTFHYAPAFDRL
ncbi:GNAT family N-acetyltransferase [Amycolatopsis sp. YIM 10]|uniref:GNAT family N-acetyltransferase n=1 Tax=Amycolatopsis sp. YIM 10 TaxID=2653857 RepID=UPI00128FFE42|nr:N-acetyltransferase [Amycolatopsis sp. YIM 10]QFU86360.1 Acetyltransferase (GNAT) family protein [Amycolatopsis sp. YIM 10]